MKIRIKENCFIPGAKKNDPMRAVVKGDTPDVEPPIAVDLIAQGRAVEYTAAVDKTEKSLDKMTVDELKAYAATNSINIEGVSLKNDILEVIQAAEKDD